MELLDGTLRAYPWGSRTLIAGMKGADTPATRPEAEIWFGAHPAAPSTVHGRLLTEIIAEDPDAALGQRVSADFDGELPFLLKILAAGAPLSLQAHPSLEQAREGFDRENRAGIGLNAANRNYRDPNHKPELIVALTEFTAMVGFRRLEATLELFDALDCAAINRYRSMLTVDNEEESLRALFTTWITIPVSKRHELIQALLSSAEAYLQRSVSSPALAPVGRGPAPAGGAPGSGSAGQEGEHAFILRHILDLHDRYPGDVGVLGALLLNFYTLQPGEAIFLDAGNLHAYLGGLGVEIMANSDNVLRGGLTSKYVDVPELVRVLNFKPLDNPKVHSVSKGNVHSYPVPVREFCLDRVDVAGAERIEHEGPMIILCTSGSVTLSCGADELTLCAAQSVWVPAADGVVTVRSEQAEVFIARV